MLELVVEHQAGIPVLMQPFSGNSHDGKAFGQVVSAHIAQLHTPANPAYLVADSALYSAENLQNLAETRLKWITRVPATLHEAQAVLAQADPQTMAPLTEGYRYHVVPSSYGGVAQRWVLIYSSRASPGPAHRRQAVAPAECPRSQSLPDAVPHSLSCEADAHQALARFTHDVQSTFLSTVPFAPRPTMGSGGDQSPAPSPPDRLPYRWRPGVAAHGPPGAGRPAQLFSPRDKRTGRGPVVRPGGAGWIQRAAHVERGFRFLEKPQFLASSLYLKKPERVMALLMVMTVCLLVYAALEYRIRTVLKKHEATFPDQKGKRIQNPTARWVFHYFVGIHLLYIPGQGLLILNLTDEHQHLLQLLGKRYAWFYR